MNYSPDFAAATIKMILSLSFVLAMVWGLYRLAKKRMPMVNSNGKSQFIQVVENHCLGIKKQIAMVKVPGSVLVLGIDGEKISLLTQIDDPTIIKNIEAVQTSSESAMSFKDQLRRFTHGSVKKEMLIHDESMVEQK